MMALADEGVQFEMKDAGMSELIPNDNWKEEANLRIERIRKGDINIQ